MCIRDSRFSYITESKDGDIWCKSYDNRAYLFDIQTEKFIDILLPLSLIHIYTAGELIRLLLNHPETEIVFINSSSNAGNRITDVHEGLYGETDLRSVSYTHLYLKMN